VDILHLTSHFLRIKYYTEVYRASAKVAHKYVLRIAYTNL